MFVARMRAWGGGRLGRRVLGEADLKGPLLFSCLKLRKERSR